MTTSLEMPPFPEALKRYSGRPAAHPVSSTCVPAVGKIMVQPTPNGGRSAADPNKWGMIALGVAAIVMAGIIILLAVWLGMSEAKLTKCVRPGAYNPTLESVRNSFRRTTTRPFESRNTTTLVANLPSPSESSDPYSTAAPLSPM